MREEIVKLIVERLESDAEEIRRDFLTDKGTRTRFAAIDNLLPEDIARKFFDVFPPLEEMRLMNSFREKKYTSKTLDKFDSLISDITFAFQDERVIETVSKITGFEDVEGDPNLYAGGISAMSKGHFLNPHLDNSHDYEQKNYRVLNLLYYITPEWKAENGGNLELWDDDVKKSVEIPSLFNRLVLMSTNDKSWHSVNEVKADGVRCCVSNYYFSEHSPNDYETTHVTFFKARPEQKLRRIVTAVDSNMRTALRKVVKQGLGKKDIYEGEGNESKK